MSNEGGAPVELHQLFPREQDGAKTGERYEFQYHQAAADALQVLDDAQVTCVYCEWHDDYVVESAGAVRYRFHQVKTRAPSDGPWRLNEFFGIQRARGRKSKKGPPPQPTATTDSIFGRLFGHVANFGDRCEWFVFVSNAGASREFTELLDAVKASPDHTSLTGHAKDAFEGLYAALSTAFSALTIDGLFAFLQRTHLRDALGQLNDLKSCRLLIGGRICDMSEVTLTTSEAQKIGADLVAAVRERSQRDLDALPKTVAELRERKGLVLEDMLRLLSLSSAGYRELKVGGRESVVALSRLHRLCRRSGVAETLIPELCRLKTMWEGWWIVQRHIVNPLDYLALRNEGADALRRHASGSLNFNGLHAEATALAKKYGPALTSSTPITKELVFGLLMALAVEAES